MAKLPNADEAIVPELKVTHYLLSLTSKQGKGKARFFMAFGFTIEEWQTLAEALQHHARTHEVASMREITYGILYSVEGALLSPDGRNPQVRSVWKIVSGETVPSLVTAYPLSERDNTDETI